MRQQDEVTRVMEELHVELANEFLRRVKMGDATPADLNGARQFLRDNGIDAVAMRGSPLQKLAMVLPFEEQQVIEVPAKTFSLPAPDQVDKAVAV
jgi:hypothetical protein